MRGGQMDNRVNWLEEAQSRQRKQQKQLHEIDKKWGILILQQEQQKKEQKEFQQETKDTLQKTLQKLNRQ